jgi:hypothetical protein
METLIGITIWVIIFIVWYVKNYPEKFRKFSLLDSFRKDRPRRKTVERTANQPRAWPKGDFKSLAETVERISSRDSMYASDAAAMAEAVKSLLEIEPASGQLWEALALDAMETAEIICDECGKPVEKIVKRTGVKIQCYKCEKWLALKNSKVTVIDPKRVGAEDWEH